MAEKIQFSYVDRNHKLWQRAVIRAIETVSGQPKLRALYADYRRNGPKTGENFFDSALRLLDLDVRYDPAQLDKIPREGPLVVIANHPYGVVDGLAISYLVGKARPDFLVVAHGVLTRAPEAERYILPIDFSEQPGAVETNLKSRKAALTHLENGGCLVVFPAGGVATTPSPFAAQAIDLRWGPLTAKLIHANKAPVVPIYFEGQNSRMFQIASHVSYILRLSLYFREVRRKIGKHISAVIGDPIPYEEMAGMRDRGALMEWLRTQTMALAPHRPSRLQRLRLRRTGGRRRDQEERDAA